MSGWELVGEHEKNESTGGLDSLTVHWIVDGSAREQMRVYEVLSYLKCMAVDGR